MKKVIEILRVVFNFDHLYISGGSAKLINFDLDDDVTIVNNREGIKGGMVLWKQFGEENVSKNIKRMKIGIAADHGGFELKNTILQFLKEKQFEVKDFGALQLDSGDDYPDFVIPLAEAVAKKEVDRGIAVCGSGVGASVAANKVAGVRATLIHDHFSAHQGVEDDDMNLICLGGRVTAYAAAEELIMAFLNAKYVGAERFERRLQKIRKLEEKNL